MMTVPIPLPLARLVPAVELFAHPSTLHGQAHVSRVMVHAFRLLEATGWPEEAPRLWAAVYLHDIARTHDGRCYRHGGDAMKRLETLPQVRELFAQGGVHDGDYALIRTAVVHHSLPNELDRNHPHWRLTSLLKDADGLDRVRLGDLLGDSGILRLATRSRLPKRSSKKPIASCRSARRISPRYGRKRRGCSVSRTGQIDKPGDCQDE
jgi:hypothetical protein